MPKLLKVEAVVFVEVTDEPIQPARPYQKDGVTKLIPARQKIYIHQGARYPLESSIVVHDERGPLRPGRYLMAGDCFEPRASKSGYVNIGFNSMNLDLVPLDEAVAHLTGSKRAA